MLRLLGTVLFAIPLALAQKHPGLTVLEQRCAACHTGAAKKSGLDISSRNLLLRGGDRGPAILPGDANQSLLYKVAARLAEPHMPFKASPLKPSELTSLAAWINEGAHFDTPPATTQSPKPTSNHWAFQSPVRPAIPAVKAANPIDAFLAVEHRRRNLQPVPEAAKRTLARRLYLDLTGVPPSREELQAFLTDPSPNAYESLVDRLLADPRYGERWGRHWMDIWRYSDWYGWRRGNDVRNSAKFLWRWRDWIVESLNADKGYDRMIVEMLAGDELAPGDPNTIRATGYLARSFSKYDRHGWLQDAVDHTAMAFMGITLKCARCHDHKYDPFTQEDYFRFRAFFEPYEVRTDRVPGQTDIDKDGISRVFDANPEAKTQLLIRGDIQNPDPDSNIQPATPSVLGAAPLKITPVSLKVDQFYPDIRPFVQQDLIAKARADAAKAEKELAEAKDGNARRIAERSLQAAQAYIPALEARLAAERAKYSRPPDPKAEELAAEARKLERAAGALKAHENLLRAQIEFDAAMAATPPAEKKLAEAQKKLEAAVEALKQAPEGQFTPIGKTYPEKSSGRRLALARWIAAKQNPLTARVAVNHIWTRHFGKGLVPTLAEFGINGKRPENPQLLDWLAVELMDGNWSMKRIHRLIVTSAAYRRRSTAGTTDHANLAADPDNIHLWRMNPRRMESEAVRDSLLAVAGTLDTKMGGPELDGTKALTLRRRSIYIEHTPDVPVPFLKIFDQANPAECYQREESVVPHQALALANSELSREQAAILTKRLEDAGQDNAQFVRSAFEAVLGRPPAPAEQQSSLAFLKTDKDREDLIHVLLNHNDFVTIR
ncbi:MAG: DUF1553 domain-containing protein [Bryobacterales bacterium]|nr:DUF1553 domain-containing protein [Bryobacterales bacterium]